jgi:Glycosyl hydrolases family 43
MHLQTASPLAAVMAAAAVVACGSQGTGTPSQAAGAQDAEQSESSPTGPGGTAHPPGDDATGPARDGAPAGGMGDGSGAGPRDADATADGGSGAASCTVAPGSIVGVFTDPVTVTPIAPPDPPGITFMDTDGHPVDAHGGGIIKECDTFYLHGEYFLSTTTNNDFNGFSMYSSKDLAVWKNEGIILPQQASGQLGPKRKGERPHIIKCPATGEFVLYAHSADETYQADKEVVYATSNAVNKPYAFHGSLLSGTGTIAAHSDMSALTDGSNAYVVTESGWVYTLATDCRSWVSAKQYTAVNGTTGGAEAPTVFKAGNTYYWIGSDKTGWRANDNFYSTAPAMTGPWTYQGYVAPQGAKTWMSQTTWVEPVVGSQGTVYVFWGDHWYGDQDTTAPGQHNDRTTFVFQPLVFDGMAISMPTYEVSWKLDVGAGTWSK